MAEDEKVATFAVGKRRRYPYKYCPCCGKQISNLSQICKSCYNAQPQLWGACLLWVTDAELIAGRIDELRRPKN